MIWIQIWKIYLQSNNIKTFLKFRKVFFKFNLYAGAGCPICCESKGEKEIRNYLISKNIAYYYDHSFQDCRYKLPLPFDFYLPSYNLCIEFDGLHHYEEICYRGEKLYTIQLRDSIKNNYCLEKGIRLLRIPYWGLKNVHNILRDYLLVQFGLPFRINGYYSITLEANV